MKIDECPFCGGEAIVVKTESCGRYIGCWDCGGRTEEFETDYAGSAHDKAIAAWNRRAESENKPLTLDEMNALNHEPIYILHMDGHGKWSMNGWHIATASSYRNHGRCDLEIDNGNTIIDMQNYGKTWLAYRSKPKEE